MRIGIDIGGTFTDVTVYDQKTGCVLFGKSLSTPENLVAGIMTGLQATGTAVETADLIIHGSTVAINALLERKGARTALLTTSGFRDVYEIGRINRPDSFNLFFKKHRPLVPRELIFEVDERMQADGTAWKPLTPADAQRAVALLEDDVESVAVVFLHAYRNPEHEQSMARELAHARPDLFITTSAEISREYREYERTSTTVANAFIGPKVSVYLADLQTSLERAGFGKNLMIMQSSGGLYDAETARSQCIQMLESGPAGGVVGASVLCDMLGIERAICFDMGGTTAKAAVIQRGVVGLSSDYFIGTYNDGLAIRIPVVDIKEVGTGGGSIAWLDASRGLRVGPQSSGAEPGPACYSRGGTQPTVTDANVIIGRLSPDRFMGGRMQLDVPAAATAFREQIAAPLDLAVEESAAGAIAIANAAMANAVRAVTTERGLDPRDFVMIAYGGGGPLHAADIARELGVNTVLIPEAPGHFSALGMLMGDLRREYVRTHVFRMDDDRIETLEQLYGDMANEANAWVDAADLRASSFHFERAADMRYVGQEHSVTVPIPGDLGAPGAREDMKATFDRYHEQRFSHSAPDEPAEVVSVRLSIVGVLEKPAIRELPLGDAVPKPAARRTSRRMRVDPMLPSVDVPVYVREKLSPGNVVSGPALIEETASSTIVPTGAKAAVNGFGYLVITMEGNE